MHWRGTTCFAHITSIGGTNNSCTGIWHLSDIASYSVQCYVDNYPFNHCEDGSTVDTFYYNHTCIDCSSTGYPGPNDCDPNQERWCEFPVCQCRPITQHDCNNASPVILDVAGNGFALTDAAHGVNFDVDGDGTAERRGWTVANSDDAFLVLDRNHDGHINNGLELFGDVTPQLPDPRPNGFRALADYDRAAQGGNGDGWIGPRDAIFSQLRLWQDTNHNGRSEASELHMLPSLGVHRLDLDYKTSKRTDQYGNAFRYRAKVKDAQGAQVGRWAWDVFLVGG